MTINIITLFEIPFGNEQQVKKLDAHHVTALTIWLVEGINNPDVHPLKFNDELFIWRVNPEKGEGHFKVKGYELPMNLLQARELVDEIEKLAERDLLLDDTYPNWVEYNSLEYYQVSVIDGVLAYRHGDNRRHLLPVALKLDDKDRTYQFIIGEKEKSYSPYYKFG